MSSLTLPNMNGSSASKPPQSWLQSSVWEFFTNWNWEDHPPEVQAIRQTRTEASSEPLSLNTSVSRFFAVINWEGSAIAAPVSQPELSAPEPAADLTLDDFSGLF